LLLDHCGAIVHHGGIGTTAQALKCGTPQLICYRMAEQADNARWLKRMGVCETMAYQQLNREVLASKLTKLLHDRIVAGKCSEIKNKVRRDSPEQKLAPIITELIEC
ncbi:MAG TPA: nucleotide disphospho-sugar-binding domain-containing protein, partial [Bacillota bacterium]|nr:nucleotide disphospho-sugar-binding domain-containing protein [Bacillota bacterium]